MQLHKLINTITIWIWLLFFIVAICFFNASPLLTEVYRTLLDALQGKAI